MYDAEGLLYSRPQVLYQAGKSTSFDEWADAQTLSELLQHTTDRQDGREAPPILCGGRLRRLGRHRRPERSLVLVVSRGRHDAGHVEPGHRRGDLVRRGRGPNLERQSCPSERVPSQRAKWTEQEHPRTAPVGVSRTTPSF